MKKISKAMKCVCTSVACLALLVLVDLQGITAAAPTSSQQSELSPLVSLPQDAAEVYAGSGMYRALISQPMSAAIEAQAQSDWERYHIAKESNLGLPLGSVYLNMQGSQYVELAIYERAAFTVLNGKPARQLLSAVLSLGRIEVALDFTDFGRQISLSPNIEQTFFRLPIAGEGGPQAPSFATMRALLTADKARAVDSSWVVADRILTPRGDLIALDPSLNVKPLSLGEPDSTTGHRVPDEIAAGLRGMFQEQVTEQAGLPLGPAVWIWTNIKGTPRLVVVQVFERTIVTYNPDYDEANRVQVALGGQILYKGLTSSTAPPTCPATIPNGNIPPAERARGAQPGGYHGNGILWTTLPRNGILRVTPRIVLSDGTISEKFWWWRSTDFAGDGLGISGRRLDGPAPALGYSFPGVYPGDFQASSLHFPREGCWEVTGKVPEGSLTFVLSVVKVP